MEDLHKLEQTAIIILAGGQGSRLKSSKPKILHKVGGQSLLLHLLKGLDTLLAPVTLATATSNKWPIFIVYNDNWLELESHIATAGANLPPGLAFNLSKAWQLHQVPQPERLGTGDALKQAYLAIKQAQAAGICSPTLTQVLVLNGDLPFIATETLASLLNANSKIAMAVASLADPGSLGRVIRANPPNLAAVAEIIEAKDWLARSANAELTKQPEAAEINVGAYCFQLDFLAEGLPLLSPKNQQQEYYLTDLIKIANQQYGLGSVQAVTVTQPIEARSINDKRELAELEQTWQEQQRQKYLTAGITMLDPKTTWFFGENQLATDIEISPNVWLENCIIGEQVTIGPNVQLRNVVIHPGTTILANTVIESAIIHADSSIGPFARIRPGSVIGPENKIGNFVELKNASLDRGVKVGHLSYLGDAKVGANVNIGAGSITCNYDGQAKHQTIIEANAMVGAGSLLIAPINIAQGAYLGAGTTLLKNAPAYKVTINPKTQIVLRDINKL